MGMTTLADHPVYKAFTSPFTLTTTEDHLRAYPKHGELMRWYLCLRKYPYAQETHAALVVFEKGEEYSHFPCQIDPTHWHIGRGHGKAPRNMLTQRAKRRFRKAVRDEIWAAHEKRSADGSD